MIRSASVYPCVYKCTIAIFVNSDTNIFCILSIVLANLISSAANVDFPSTPSSYPKNAFGILNAACILFLKYSISSICPSLDIPGNASIDVPDSPPLTGK